MTVRLRPESVEYPPVQRAQAEVWRVRTPEVLSMVALEDGVELSLSPVADLDDQLGEQQTDSESLASVRAQLAGLPARPMERQPIADFLM